MKDESICLCTRCNRPLKSKRSIKFGIGPRCRVRKAEEDFLKNQVTIFDILGGENDVISGTNSAACS